jgi:uncharacterized protein (DUF885 family)
VSDPADDLRALANDYWEGMLRRNPTLATFYGDYRYNDRLPDIGPTGRAEEERELKLVLDRLSAVPTQTLETEDQITWDMLRLAAQSGLDALRLRLDEMAIDQMDGPQVWLPQLLNWHPLDSSEHIAQLVARFQAFGAWIDDYLAALEDGVRDGRTAPAIAVDRVLGQLRTLLGTPVAESPFVRPLRDRPQEDAVRQAVEGVVYPAYRRVLDFVESYRPRSEPGVWSVMDGPEIYALLARQHTTTDLTPDELHQIGLDELRAIHAEMRGIVDRRASTDTTIRQFTESLIRDPANLPTSRDTLIEAAEQLLQQAREALPRAFGRLPHQQLTVKAVEEFRERDSPAAYYFPGAPDGSRPANFYINTFEPASRPRHTLPALAFHEGLPGHHLQIALAQETGGLPTFRRLSAGWLANAFVEGWALYTERLADELGLYPDELARYGMLGYQAWRACRLVVDTGLHHLRWSRDQAIAFFFDNVGLSERETVNEVDRYIVWPGQALAYKVGQREIEKLRRGQEQRLGPTFDLRAFHDNLLGHAAVPLSSLGRIILD